MDGLVTDDSDAFLFGAKIVYKNLFHDQRYLEAYRSEDIKNELGLDREQLVAFAYFLGSDYTEGVRGIGLVNAVEILSVFPMHGGVIEGLGMFRTWLEGFSIKEKISQAHKDDDEILAEFLQNIDCEALSEEQIDKLAAFHRSHRSSRSKWSLADSFPNPKVAEEYFSPKANREASKFTWTVPQIDQVSQFCTTTLGWTEDEISRSVIPIVCNTSQGVAQTRIDSFFYTQYKDNVRFAKGIYMNVSTYMVLFHGLISL